MWAEKNAMSGPTKNAVMIVPTPTGPETRRAPTRTMRSWGTRTRWYFHPVRSTMIGAIAS
ncbi:hypothetical protein JCM18882A_01810 [Brevibacterium metallidurans]|uniref:Uncharacterized protein n=1 Tax=Brevibacterium metallidurans TaxID=1482676 RepID=A0ABN0SKA6_9MICO